MLIVQVDIIDTEPFERGRAALLDVFPISRRPKVVHVAKLGCEEVLVAFSCTFEPADTVIHDRHGEKESNIDHFPMRSSESPYTFAVYQWVLPFA